MNTFKKAKVILLSHNNINTSLTLYKTASGKPLHLSTNLDILSHHTNQHLYIISDDEIKEGDWCINTGGNIKDSFPFRVTKEVMNNKFIKKIIATTDESLKIDNDVTNQTSAIWDKNSIKKVIVGNKILPKLSDSFIQKYVEEYNKGNVITDVLVEYEETKCKCLSCGRTVASICNYPEKCNIQIISNLKINPKDNTITIKKVKDNWNYEEQIDVIEKYLLTKEIDVYRRTKRSDIKKWVEENL